MEQKKHISQKKAANIVIPEAVSSESVFCYIYYIIKSQYIFLMTDHLNTPMEAYLLMYCSSPVEWKRSGLMSLNSHQQTRIERFLKVGILQHVAEQM